MGGDYIASIRIDEWSGGLLVTAYDARAWLKAIGGKWRPAQKAWWIPSYRLDEVVDELERVYGYQVVIAGQTRRRLGDDWTPRTTRSASWAADMFAALPEHLHDAVYKALIRVLHPDVGGDVRTAQQLNDARPEPMRSAS